MIPGMNRNLMQLQLSGIRRFTNLAAATPGCVRLTLGEPDFNTPENIREAAKRALDENKTHYPPNAGSLELRKALCEFEAQRNGYDYTEQEVFLTIGATEAIHVAMLGVLNPGDEVIIPNPAFGLYDSIAKLAGASIVTINTSEDAFQLKAEKLAAAITERTKLLILNSPNNPTGVVYSRETLDALHEVLKDKPIFVLCDDVYQQLSYSECCSFATFRDMRDRILMVQSFSKPYAMTGWRVGYLMAQKEVMDHLLLYHAADTVSIPAFVQDACIEALHTDVSPMVEVYRQRRDLVYQAVLDMGLQVTKPEGAFYLFPDIRPLGISSEEFCTRAITEGGVAVVPGACFGAEGFFRISCCYSTQELQVALGRLKAFVQSLK
ncbi:MAG: pyridoxal phosphate-dependent aminotransferase [Oscillospiraceae bacterium]|nr:pyridoxal phosphate-dependent aminotransferase [Oscillospiraceae bacterium]